MKPWQMFLTPCSCLSREVVESVAHNTFYYLQVVFKDSVATKSISQVEVFDDTEPRLGFFTAQVPADGIVGLPIVLLQKDELVRNHAHLLKSDSLGLCPRETFDNPTLLSLFHLFNLLLYELNNNLVLDVTVSLERLLNVLAILLVLLSDLASDEVSNRDALEVFTLLVEVGRETQSDLLALATWRSHKNDASCYNKNRNG